MKSSLLGEKLSPGLLFMKTSMKMNKEDEQDQDSNEKTVNAI
jgi:hypothetical protein